MTNAGTTDTAAHVAEQGATVAPAKGPSKKGPGQKKGAPKGQKAAKGGITKAASKAAAADKKVAKPAPAKSTAPRAESKGAKILELIERPKGATLAELMKVTGWQAHSVRGYLSGTVGRKMSLPVQSTRREDGVRVYLITR